jgi:hypothetical protein
MLGHAYKITLNQYDSSGAEELFIRADRVYAEGNAICFYRDEEKTDSNPYPDSMLVAYLPADRVFEIEIMDDETGETAGFLPPES